MKTFQSRKGLRFLILTFMVSGLCLLNILYSVKGVALSLPFYQSQWVNLEVQAETGMSLDDMSRAGESLVNYFTGKADTPQIRVGIFGTQRDLYNGSELMHLADVKALFRLGLKGIWYSWLLALSGVVAALFLGNDGKSSRCGTISGGLKTAALISISLLVLLAVPATLDFSQWWTGFHLIAFTNDLWLLDPAQDWLIRMFPGEFFYSAVKSIGLNSLLISGLYLALGFSINHFSADYRH